MQRELRDGLILRSLSEGVESDRENLPRFYQHVFGLAGDSNPIGFTYWTQDLMSDKHPTTTLDDLWVVVDPARDNDANRSQGGNIVSALLLIPQTWVYEDVEIGVGRVELVATYPDYRQRGLVRAMMDAAHERSAALGHVMQSITGIPNYYRRFGYTMAVDLGARGMVPMISVPSLKDDQKPKYSLRSARPDDFPQLVEWDRSRARSSAISMIRTPEIWDYELNMRHAEAPFRMEIRIISRLDDQGGEAGEDVGYVMFRTGSHYKDCSVFSYVVGEKSSYLDTYEDVLRHIKSYAEAKHGPGSGIEPYLPDFIRFDSGVSEPLDLLINFTFGARVFDRTYAWYVRVPDLPRFMELIRPVLERRLVGSGANRYTGELKIGFFDLTGLVITFEDGTITGVETRPFAQNEEDVAFPYFTFLNVLFGHLTMREMEATLPEIFANRKARVLIDALFPRRRSWLVGLG
jgi:hypothetical protein